MSAHNWISTLTMCCAIGLFSSNLVPAAPIDDSPFRVAVNETEHESMPIEDYEDLKSEHESDTDPPEDTSLEPPSLSEQHENTENTSHEEKQSESYKMVNGEPSNILYHENAQNTSQEDKVENNGLHENTDKNLKEENDSRENEDPDHTTPVPDVEVFSHVIHSDSNGKFSRLQEENSEELNDDLDSKESENHSNGDMLNHNGGDDGGSPAETHSEGNDKFSEYENHEGEIHDSHNVDMSHNTQEENDNLASTENVHEEKLDVHSEETADVKEDTHHVDNNKSDYGSNENLKSEIEDDNAGHADEEINVESGNPEEGKDDDDDVVEDEDEDEHEHDDANNVAEIDSHFTDPDDTGESSAALHMEEKVGVNNSSEARDLKEEHSLPDNEREIKHDADVASVLHDSDEDDKVTNSNYKHDIISNEHNLDDYDDYYDDDTSAGKQGGDENITSDEIEEDHNLNITENHNDILTSSEGKENDKVEEIEVDKYNTGSSHEEKSIHLETSSSHELEEESNEDDRVGNDDKVEILPSNEFEENHHVVDVHLDDNAHSTSSDDKNKSLETGVQLESSETHANLKITDSHHNKSEFSSLHEYENDTGAIPHDENEASGSHDDNHSLEIGVAHHDENEPSVSHENENEDENGNLGVVNHDETETSTSPENEPSASHENDNFGAIHNDENESYMSHENEDENYDSLEAVHHDENDPSTSHGNGPSASHENEPSTSYEIEDENYNFGAVHHDENESSISHVNENENENYGNLRVDHQNENETSTSHENEPSASHENDNFGTIHHDKNESYMSHENEDENYDSLEAVHHDENETSTSHDNKPSASHENEDKNDQFGAIHYDENEPYMSYENEDENYGNLRVEHHNENETSTSHENETSASHKNEDENYDNLGVVHHGENITSTSHIDGGGGDGDDDDDDSHILHEHNNEGETHEIHEGHDTQGIDIAHIDDTKGEDSIASTEATSAADNDDEQLAKTDDETHDEGSGSHISGRNYIIPDDENKTRVNTIADFIATLITPSKFNDEAKSDINKDNENHNIDELIPMFDKGLSLDPYDSGSGDGSHDHNEGSGNGEDVSIKSMEEIPKEQTDIVMLPESPTTSLNSEHPEEDTKETNLKQPTQRTLEPSNTDTEKHEEDETSEKTYSQVTHDTEESTVAVPSAKQIESKSKHLNVNEVGLGEQSTDPDAQTQESSTGSYIVLGVIMVVIVALLVYSVIRSRRRRQAKKLENPGTEMKDVGRNLLPANGNGNVFSPLHEGQEEDETKTKLLAHPEYKSGDDEEEEFKDAEVVINGNSATDANSQLENVVSHSTETPVDPPTNPFKTMGENKNPDHVIEIGMNRSPTQIARDRFFNTPFQQNQPYEGISEGKPMEFESFKGKAAADHLPVKGEVSDKSSFPTPKVKVIEKMDEDSVLKRPVIVNRDQNGVP